MYLTRFSGLRNDGVCGRVRRRELMNNSLASDKRMSPPGRHYEEEPSLCFRSRRPDRLGGRIHRLDSATCGTGLKGSPNFDSSEVQVGHVCCNPALTVISPAPCQSLGTLLPSRNTRDLVQVG